jgi:hypothetical protein
VVQIPSVLGIVEDDDAEIFVTRYLPGVLASEAQLTTSDIERLAVSIRELQRALAATLIGRGVLSTAEASSSYYQSKTQKFLNQMGIDSKFVPHLKIFESLSKYRETGATVVSDRSPANFILTPTQVGAFDFCLLLAGSETEDWSWFIDDPRLHTSVSRNEMLTIFANVYRQPWSPSHLEYRELFNVASMFVCMKQASIMLAINRVDMAGHYLRMLQVSAAENDSREAMILAQIVYEGVSKHYPHVSL